jgi:lysine/ornithine N-monooxygenase
MDWLIKLFLLYFIMDDKEFHDKVDNMFESRLKRYIIRIKDLANDKILTDKDMNYDKVLFDSSLNIYSGWRSSYSGWEWKLQSFTAIKQKRGSEPLFLFFVYSS